MSALFTSSALEPACHQAVTCVLIGLSPSLSAASGRVAITAVCKQCAQAGYAITSCLDVLAHFYGGNDLNNAGSLKHKAGDTVSFVLTRYQAWICLIYPHTWKGHPQFTGPDFSDDFSTSGMTRAVHLCFTLSSLRGGAKLWHL